MTLGSGFKYPKKHNSYNVFDSQVEYDAVESDTDVIIKPHSFILGASVEVVKLPNDVSALLQGRSSAGRLGLIVLSGWVDAGYSGVISLQLYNTSDVPIRLAINTRIAQLIFMRMDRHCANSYKGVYQNASEALGFIAPEC